jgi:hypothetical protein
MKTETDTTNKGLFSQLKYELKHVMSFDDDESALLPFILRENGLRPGDITDGIMSYALLHNISPERVRQLIQKLEGKIKRHIKSCIIKYEIDISGYARANFFIVDQNFVNDINRIENTTFSVEFVILIFTCLFREYYWVSVIHWQKHLSGIFYDRKIKFDFSGCLRYVLRITGERVRKSHSRLEFEKLFRLFPVNNSDRDIIVSIINEYVSRKNNILIDKLGISIVKNSPAKNDIIASVLEDVNCPLHFTKIYDLLIKKGFDFKSPSMIYSTLSRDKITFGQKGRGIYGLKKWGGYFGNINDVAVQYLNELQAPVKLKTLRNFICTELTINRDSIAVALTQGYKKQFIRLPGKMIALRKVTQIGN